MPDHERLEKAENTNRYSLIKLVEVANEINKVSFFKDSYIVPRYKEFVDLSNKLLNSLPENLQTELKGENSEIITDMPARQYYKIFKNLESHYMELRSNDKSQRAFAFNIISLGWQKVLEYEEFEPRYVKNLIFQELDSFTKKLEEIQSKREDFGKEYIEYYRNITTQFLTINDLPPSHKIFKDIDEPDPNEILYEKFRLLQINAEKFNHDTHSRLFKRVSDLWVQIRMESKKGLKNINTNLDQNFINFLDNFKLEYRKMDPQNSESLKEFQSQLTNETMLFIIVSDLNTELPRFKWDVPYSVFSTLKVLTDKQEDQKKVLLLEKALEAWKIFI